MSELGTLRVWKDPAILTALSWYLDVAENRRPAKFHIAATIATELDPAESSEAALWAELDGVTPIFLARWGTIRPGASLPRWRQQKTLSPAKEVHHATCFRKTASSNCRAHATPFR